jgi:predicted thioesterase
MEQIKIGRQGRLERTVEPDDSADRYGNAGVMVLATPALCHWFETPGVITIEGCLEAGEATVGTRLEIEHLKATPIGMQVTVVAEVMAAEGRRVRFRIEAHDEKELIARGTHERYVVNLNRFLEGVRSKAAIT